MMSVRDRLLKKTARRYKTVLLPDGDAVTIRNLTSAELRAYRKSFIDKNGELRKDRFDLRNELLVVRCVVDDDNTPVLTEDDVLNGVLDEMDGAVIEALSDACKVWTGLQSDESMMGAVGDAVKNSDDDRENSGYTASPPVSVVST